MKFYFFITIFLFFSNVWAGEKKLKISLNLNIEEYPIYINDIGKKINKHNSNINLLKLVDPIIKKNFSPRDYKEKNQFFYIKMKYKF